jgi:hypothetical protein
MRLIHGKYECALCGAELDLPPDEEPRIEIHQAAGEKQVIRVIVIDHHELHRCEVVAPAQNP